MAGGRVYQSIKAFLTCHDAEIQTVDRRRCKLRGNKQGYDHNFGQGIENTLDFGEYGSVAPPVVQGKAKGKHDEEKVR